MKTAMRYESVYDIMGNSRRVSQSIIRRTSDKFLIRTALHKGLFDFRKRVRTYYNVYCINYMIVLKQK